MKKWATVALILIAGLSYGQSEPTGLSEAGQAFLSQLERAGWSGHSAANGVDVTVRRAPLFSAGMLSAVRNRKSLSDGQRKALEDVVRIVLPQAGWFLATPVAAGSYRIGLDFDGKNPQIVLFDANGKRIIAEAIWINETADKIPGGSVVASGGSMMVSVSTGGIALSYRFVPRPRHDSLTDGLTTTTHGKVRIHSDLKAPKHLKDLAKVAANSLTAQAALLGCAVPDEPFEIFLIDNADRYEALDLLVTGGSFKDAWAFTSRITGWSYLRYGARSDPGALADAGFPLKVRSLVLHELNHQLSRRAFPHGVTLWPDWLTEGLAELGAQRAFQASSRIDGKAFHDFMLGNWLHADRIGAVPPPADLAGGAMDSGRTGFYNTCYLLAKEMAKKPKLLHELLDAVGEESVAPQAHVRARQEFERLYGRMDSVLARAEKSARSTKKPPRAVTMGYCDTIGDEWRMVSVPKSAARVLLAKPVAKEDGVTVTANFSFHPSGQQQLDVYVGHREGRHTAQFLKLAVLPKRMVLFWFRHGSWRTCGTINYDDALAIGTTAERKWHPLTVRYRVEDRKLRVDTTGGRWAEFEVPGYVPVAGTQVGVGLYDGVAYVKDVTFK